MAAGDARVRKGDVVGGSPSNVNRRAVFQLVETRLGARPLNDPTMRNESVAAIV
jgi:hypothetical protein